ncbi:hypothetical protein SAMN05444486_1116 [Lentibacter algarum]|uniref:Uncharacterized protein n=1 Tax=Lentibacter algarum TaxID=576131 RepID=A0A1H3NKL0_9RHOB|nr:hypothetical protein [Lentibacter algarum]SDY89283.1 hypothetical protein SAMN05444486_1116 [Lentibacter algarum]
MSSSFYADVFKVHHHSTITIGVPTFIPFVLPVLACAVLPYKFIYHFDKTSAQKWFNAYQASSSSIRLGMA